MTTLLESATYRSIEAKRETFTIKSHKTAAKIVVTRYVRISWDVKPAKKYKIVRARTLDRQSPNILVKLPRHPHTEAKIYEFFHPSTKLLRKEAVTIMAAFRKDLFVSVTLPILGLGVVLLGIVGGAYAYTWSAFTRLDDAAISMRESASKMAEAQAASAQQLSALADAQKDSNAKLDKVSEQLNQMNGTLLVLKTRADMKDSSTN
ncbi:hypothetical protein [Pseudomonas aeruginosa]|uniref:hypothetical protein n=1 Tax=Pseudomonas aeruginosa TaxID=287 RepID=UPI0004F2EDBA|nr:hypothetical protein [Pseudomonas aeruginosa]ELP1324028.1 hypothetical protein [Pseudomonas aeruginosa]KSC59339.1 hypothetical protein AO895_25150 [Pseudomonas aeruginosa]MBI7344595.1 hypothetical protein [Pseudomonas aeruginosa]MBI7371174.1 hypothetical protein [Pseudomonas aeruginosa]MBI8624890.1 hypothetical protein [Pseudomonas aeruginosa]